MCHTKNVGVTVPVRVSVESGVCLCISENGGGDGGSSSVAGVTQRCGDDAATTVDVKCTSLVPPRDNDSSATASLTSGHVTGASEHDHMVSSTIHSDGRCRFSSRLLFILPLCLPFARRLCFWATLCKTVRPVLSDRCLSVCL